MTRYFLFTWQDHDADGRRLGVAHEVALEAENAADMAQTLIWSIERGDAIKGWTPTAARRFARAVWSGPYGAAIRVDRGRRLGLEAVEMAAVEYDDFIQNQER